jgi:hypothetical protein
VNQGLGTSHPYESLTSGISLQIKATQKKLHEKNGLISFPLNSHNYNDLIGPQLFPQILVLFVVGNPDLGWVLTQDGKTVVNGLGYWVSMESMLPSVNKYKVTVKVPKAQAFTVEALKRIMLEMDSGRYPHELV